MDVSVHSNCCTERLSTPVTSCFLAGSAWQQLQFKASHTAHALHTIYGNMHCIQRKAKYCEVTSAPIMSQRHSIAQHGPCRQVPHTTQEKVAQGMPHTAKCTCQPPCGYQLLVHSLTLSLTQFTKLYRLGLASSGFHSHSTRDKTRGQGQCKQQ